MKSSFGYFDQFAMLATSQIFAQTFILLETCPSEFSQVIYFICER